MKEGTIITSIDELKGLFDEQHECDTAVCSILLNGGFKSWKNISFDGDHYWWVYNEIDETEDEFATDEELMNSIVGEAIKKHALIFEWF